MSNKAGNTSGKFAPKSETPRRICSVNLTDETWQRLGAVAEKTGKSRNDFLESLLQGNNPFIETVEPQPQPLIETVETDREVNDVNIKKQQDSELPPFMGTVQFELEALKQKLADAKADYIKLLESSIHITSKLPQEVQGLLLEIKAQTTSGDELREELEDKEVVCGQLQSQLETVQAELEAYKKQQPEAEFEPPQASDLLNRLKAKRKKSTASLADIEAILEILEES